MTMKMSRIQATAGALVLLATTACGSVNLVDEYDMEPYATLLASERERFDRTVHVRADEPGEPPFEMALHIYRSAQGASERVLILIPGILGDHRTWRFVAGPLAENHDLIIVDPPGTGDSARPDPDELGPNSYSTTWLARHVCRAVSTWLEDQGDERPLAIVAHSLGGAVAFEMLGNPDIRRDYAPLCERVEALALLAPADPAVAKADPVFKELASLTAVEVEIGSLLGVLRSKVEASIVDAVVDPDRCAFKVEADRIIEQLTDGPTRRAVQATLRRFAKFDDHELPVWEANQRLEAHLANVEVPCLILWGRRDETLPVAMGYKLMRQLPNARLEVIQRAKHSAMQEHPLLCVRRVEHFLEDVLGSEESGSVLAVGSPTEEDAPPTASPADKAASR